ncbi:MAG: STAS domain-containing protein [Candidatus Riflebacteria bacterium]|nr:STAS domain-containing protein [Candidatus Riflebacteria bacterium]
MSIQLVEIEGVRVVRVLDLSDNDSVVALKDALQTITTGADLRIVLDMELLDYVNSMGIGVMVNLLKKVNESGGKLVLQSPRDNVRQLFRILGLDKIFTIVRSRADAMTTLGHGRGRA